VLTSRAGKWPLPSKLSDVVKNFGFVFGVLLVLTAPSGHTPKKHREWESHESRLKVVSPVEGETIGGHFLQSRTPIPLVLPERR
jgi:hypothetical protein